jgi:lysozyme
VNLTLKSSRHAGLEGSTQGDGMKVTEEGFTLIRESEGFRARAYRDAVGIWTIGYGHTSAAGAPDVKAGDEVSREDAETILTRDVEMFAGGVARLVTQALSDAQFSALVSFAYNVGLGNFKGSGVLRAVNEGDFASVPRRLAAWNKAQGRVLPGLVKRRAAEAELFAKDEPRILPKPVDPPRGKPAARSTTIWAAAAIAIVALFNQLALYLGYAVMSLAAVALIVACAMWIIRERRRKMTEEGV